MMFLAEAGAAGGITIETITSTLSNLVTLASTCIDFMLGNPLLSICLVAGTVVPAGFALFRHAKRTAR